MFEKRYRLLWEFANGLPKSQAKTLTVLAAALIRSGRMRSFSVAEQLASASGIQFKSALQRFYRWIHNDKFDEWHCWSALAGRLLMGGGKRPLIAVDWSEWHSDLRILSAALCVGSRAVPILVQTFCKADMPRSQNTRENTFLHLLVRLSARMASAVLIFDRGFRRTSLIGELHWLKQAFVIRLAVKVTVVSGTYQGLLSAHPLRPGRRVDLGPCTLSARTPVQVRVIGVWAPGQAEPWWLATSLKASVRNVAEIYDRRMSIEEQFRDTKGCRFGVKIKWTAFQKPQAVNRMFLLTALSMMVWYAAAWLACRNDPSLRLQSASKGPRRSFLAIGIQARDEAQKVLQWHCKKLLDQWPPAQLRTFSW